ncbi:MAG: TonB-dependent receptor [Bacteroidales bacterium]|nr:TonB-dependent receptor [Bacteroidales bacterium]
MNIKYVATLLLAAIVSAEISAQQQLTREQILNMSIEELSELPLEDLMQAVETLGVSSVDELFAMIMNKNVSSASKTEEDSFTSPLSSTVITRDEMRTYGVSTIEEAFRLIPGMIVTEKLNGMYDVQMRGLNNIPDNNMLLYTENANTLIMIDGRPVQTYTMGSLNFDILPISIEDVERIEVVRGACSALYGANAVTGVINILTEKPSESSDFVSGSIQMGSHSTYVGEIALRKAFNSKVAAGLTVNMQYRERPTDKLYVIPGQDGLFYCDNASIMPEAGIQNFSPYSEKFDREFAALKETDPEAYQAKYLEAVALYKQRMQTVMASQAVGGYYSVNELGNFKQLYPVAYDADGNITEYRIFDAMEPQAPASEMFPNPQIARKQAAFNAYLTVKPAKDVVLNFTGGYQNSLANATPVGDDIMSFNGRTSKTAYVALDASVKDLRVLANYHVGPHNYAVGVPGFKINVKEFNASAEYDLHVGGLGIRPGISYQNLKYEDYAPEYTNRATYEWEFKDPGYKYEEGKDRHLSGFLYYDTELKTIAPSVRLDYKLGDVRLIGAYRADKTNIPDKWHHSWQLAASYSINENNFIRFVYGRANRGTNVVNSSADYDWERTNMVYPRLLHFEANEDADFVKIDNFELGYRWKPTNKVLVDAELFYSKSDQYGALMAHEGEMLVSQEEMTKIIYLCKTTADGYLAQGYKYQMFANKDLQKFVLLNLVNNADMGTVLEPYASIKYNQLPYEVHQVGLSFNIDYIISSKLIAKLNANLQRTIINNYYEYSQTDDVKALLQKAQNRAFGFSIDQSKYDPANPLAMYNIDGEVPQAFFDLVDRYIKLCDDNGGVQPEGVWQKAGEPLFDNYDVRRNSCHFGKTSADELERELRDGHVHKATPAFYGMLGLIYKPLQQLEVSAFANFIGKRTFLLKYGTSELDNRCTVNMKVGYKPVNNFEIFFNAHNLFNTEKREFSYCDKIGGIYTIGVNFGF